jgi:ornithine decarboxylase
LGLNLVGISFHVGSGCYDVGHSVHLCGTGICHGYGYSHALSVSLLVQVDAYSVAIRQAREVFDLAKTVGYTLTLLDIGGGFPGMFALQIYPHF